MGTTLKSTPATRRGGPIPRGLAHSGPAVLSYGFRPFFLLAAISAFVDMIVWIGALSGAWDIGGKAGPVAWHAHEMLFGYGAAALCGFVLTAVPNWTGRLPVSGRPLLALVALWLAGRLAMAVPALVGELPSAIIDALFLPALAVIVGREVIAGHNWQNLRVLVAIAILGLLNAAFQAATLWGWDPGAIVRMTVGVYVLLIGQVGGRIIPSFTRNYLSRQGAARLPSPAGRFDQTVLAVTLLAAIAWTLAPQGLATTLLAAAAALAQAVRLARWQPLAALHEPLLAVLHIGFAFIALGWAAVALASRGLMPAASALHVLTLGGVGLMTMGVMARATRGHTGHPLKATKLTVAAYACLVGATLLRPAAEMLPGANSLLLTLAGAAWIIGFGLFLAEYAPMLLRPAIAAKAGRPAARVSSRP